MFEIEDQYDEAKAGLVTLGYATETDERQSNETVLVQNVVSKLYYVQCISIGISTFLNEHFQRVQFHLMPSQCFRDFLLISFFCLNFVATQFWK